MSNSASENKRGASRRSFLKMAAGGSLATAGMLLAGCATTPAGNAEATTSSAAFDQETDVLVLGAGAGGCFAANFAMQQGAEVTVVEASPIVGGDGAAKRGLLPHMGYHP